ncbi:MAG: hypothetical protein ACI93R_002534 [Flavobacteriales bacterium]|jgi:uncharacterized protein YaiL (DUF2058 family)
MSSLQDQLLQAGLVDKKKAKQAKKDKSKKAKVDRRSPVPVVDETKERAKQIVIDKAERDRKLNSDRDALAQKKAVQAQIKQIIDLNKIRRDGEIAYNFSDGKHIKKILVTQALFDGITRGQVAIVSLGERYELVPAAIAEKIAVRDESVLIALSEKQEEFDEDDPYADYQIPDDLMW